jgi:hypothetical protein
LAKGQSHGNEDGRGERDPKQFGVEDEEAAMGEEGKLETRMGKLEGRN